MSITILNQEEHAQRKLSRSYNLKIYYISVYYNTIFKIEHHDEKYNFFQFFELIKVKVRLSIGVFVQDV